MGQVSLDVQVANEHQTGEGKNFFLPSAEFGVLHVPLHNTYERPGVREIGICDLIEHNGIPNTDLANPSVIQINEKLGWSCFATRQHMGII